MKANLQSQLESYVAQLAVRIHTASAEMDPDLLQLPGGGVIATLLWLYTKGAGVWRNH